ncbi:MAG TPA: glycosyltransferase [Solirubrobacteraceae bacterium]
MPDDARQVTLARPLPAVVRPGRGLLVPLAGRATRDGGPAPVALAVDRRAVAADAWGMPVIAADGLQADAFWGFVPLGPAVEPGTVTLRAAGTRVGEIELEPEPAAAPHGVEPGLVAVCLATHDPPAELLAAQIASLRAQTHERWVCIVCDDASSPAGLQHVRAAIAGDARFTLIESDAPLGAYRAFERCLRHVPAGARAVAFCDQDDHWDPDKLAVLLAALEPGVLLSHSDVRIVDGRGSVRSPTYWTDRRRSEERIGDLLVANTVTGMASLFRRELLDAVLPFPAPLGPDAFHDHWVALVAAARGRIAYVDRPLADYVQHDANLLGHRGRRAERSEAPRWERWQGSYCDLLLPRRALAATLLLRCADTLDDAQVSALQRIASPRLGGLAAAALRGAPRGRRTLGHEWRMLRGALWAARAHARPGDAVALRRDLADLMAPIS